MNTVIELIYSNITILIIVGIAYTLDFITGITKAIFKKNVQSSKLRKSVGKGISYVAWIVIGICLQLIFPVYTPILSEHLPILDTTYPVFIYSCCLYIIITEFLSVKENTKTFIKDIPFLSKFLETIKEKLENIEVKEGD